MKTCIPLAIVLAASTGCASGFNRKAMQERLQAENRVFTDLDVLRIEKLRPQLQIPFRMAVVPPSDDRWGVPNDGMHRQIEALGETLKSEGLISELVILPRLLLSTGGYYRDAAWLGGIRAAAARCRADAVLLLGSVSDVDRYINPLSLLNLTIAGMWIFPAHHRDALTILEGVLLDNRNEYLYVVAEGEGTASLLAPYAYIEDEDAVRKSRGRAFEAFGKEFVQKCRGLRLASQSPLGPQYETPFGK